MRYLAVPLLALAFAPAADAAVTATATRTEDPSTVQLRVRLDVTTKRSLDRKVFVDACGLTGGTILACEGEETTKRVRLSRGRTRRTVEFEVQRTVLSFVGVQTTGTPWDGYRMVPASADSLWVRLGRDGRAREVRPAPIARDTLKEGITP